MSREVLKDVVAELYQASPDSIDAEFSLQHPRFQGSVGRGVLIAAIRRRLGVYRAAAFTARTYGELEQAIFNGTKPANGGTLAEARPANGATRAPEPPVPHSGVDRALTIGVDIELLDNFPEVSDFWTSDFYRTHFTGPEIAYCARQEYPRMHFAARWCAKEALAKCDARFRDVDPATLQVAIGASGQPVFEWLRPEGPERLPHALSLTHTPILAAAVVATATAGSNGRKP